jgi:hypothetical protein
VPSEDFFNFLSRQLDEADIKPFHHILTSSFFCFTGQFYEQTDGVAMGPPLPLVIANFFMEDFEEMDSAERPSTPLWFRHVIWPHGLKS